MLSLTSGTTPIEVVRVSTSRRHADGVEVVAIPQQAIAARLSECVLTPRRPARRRDDLHEHALEGQNPPFVVRLRQAEAHERPDLDFLLIIPPARSTESKSAVVNQRRRQFEVAGARTTNVVRRDRVDLPRQDAVGLRRRPCTASTEPLCGVVPWTLLV